MIVAFVALCVQFVHLAESRSDPSFDVPVVDAQAYHERAVAFAAEGPALDRPYYQPPMFPITLGCIYAVFGPRIVVAKLILALVGVASCVLAYLLGRRLYSPAVGLVSGLLLAVYGPFVFFAAQLLPVGPAVFLNLASLNLLFLAYERPHWLRWLAFGVCTGLATITVPNSGVLLIVGVGSLVISAWRHRSWRTRCGYACMAGLAALAVVSPVTVRNYMACGEVVLISTNGGINFHIGNNPEADRTVALRPGEKWGRLGRDSLADQPRTHAQQDAYFYAKTLRYIRQEPMGFLDGLLRKTGRILSAREIPRTVDVYVHRDFSRLLSALTFRAGPFAFPFGLLAPLAAVGILVRGRSSPRILLASYLLAYAGSVVLFFITARYRLPMIPVMCVLAAAGVVWAWHQIVDRSNRVSSRMCWTAGALFVLTTLLVNRPTAAATDGVNFRAELHMHVGHNLVKAGELDAAERQLRRAIQLAPQYAQAHCRLAQVFFWRGQLEDAMRLLWYAIELDPEDSEAYWLLGAMVLEEGNAREAIALLEQALSVDPVSPLLHRGLADALVADGRLDEAVGHYRRADRIDALPNDALIRFAGVLVERGHFGEAIECYDRVLAQTGPQARVLHELAHLLATCPQAELRDCRRAIELAESLCRMTGYQHPIALDTLAASYAECGRFDEAARVVRKALERTSPQEDPTLFDTLRNHLGRYERRLGPAGDPRGGAGSGEGGS